MIRHEKLTVKSREAIIDAQSMALECGHPQVTCLHLLAAILRHQFQRGAFDGISEIDGDLARDIGAALFTPATTAAPTK